MKNSQIYLILLLGLISFSRIQPEPVYYLEAGYFNPLGKKAKAGEDVGSVLNSMRMGEQFLKNGQPTFSFYERELKSKPSAQYIFTIASSEEDSAFFRYTYKRYDNQLDYRKYYRTDENYTLDVFVGNYREFRYRVGAGPLDYFKDSVEASIEYFQVDNTGTYNLYSKYIPLGISGIFKKFPPEFFFIYDYLNLSQNFKNYSYLLSTEAQANLQKPTSIDTGNLKYSAQGWAFFWGTNTKFWNFFSFYQIVELSYFQVNATLQAFAPNQISYVKKSLPLNLLINWELGFSFTLDKIGIRWGTFITIPFLIDEGGSEEKPEGYIIQFNPFSINTIQQSKFFYSASSETNQWALSGIVIAFVSKL